MEPSQKDMVNLSPFEVRRVLFGLAQEGLQECMKNGTTGKILNAGRGNPNFLNLTVRKAYNHLSQFATDLPVPHPASPEIGFHPQQEGIGNRFLQYLEWHKELEEIGFLKEALFFCTESLGLEADELIFEWVDGILGEYYPVPPRMQKNAEKIVSAYLSNILRLENSGSRRFHLFATEGATAAIGYLFKSLTINRLLRSGDKIAVATPIYSPYLEIPPLKTYGLETVAIEAQKALNWQFPDKELDKLKDPAVKALFLVNPGNPTAAGLDRSTTEKIARLIRNERPDLLILTDEVYATFAEEYCGLIQEVPENTILIYSFSKYFGATGWRLGVLMMQENHVADRLIAKLSDSDKASLARRYGLVSASPEQLPFMDRLLLDSRDVALAHTGGLSGPQQVMMTLMAIFHLLDQEGSYRNELRAMLKRRWELFYGRLGINQPAGENQTCYYILLDLLEVAGKIHGKALADGLAKDHSLLEFLCRLAREKLTIALPGEGFGASPWTLRLSLANLKDEEYEVIGGNILEVLESFEQLKDG